MPRMQLLRTAGEGKQVYLCGHSLGGALAAALALCVASRRVTASVAHRMPAAQPCILPDTPRCQTAP